MGFIVRSTSDPYGCMECLLAVRHFTNRKKLFWDVHRSLSLMSSTKLDARVQKNQLQREPDAFFAGRSLKVRATSSIPRTPSSLRE
jgi:hypothetical protein